MHTRNSIYFVVIDGYIWSQELISNEKDRKNEWYLELYL